MLPKTADIVVIGGGCVGTSVAYHLAKRDAKKILLIERENFLGMGSTRAAAGGVRHQFSTRVNVQLSLYAVNVLAHFEELFGVPSGYRPIGYLFLLTTPQQVEIFKRNLEFQKSLGVTVEWQTPEDIRRRIPLFNLDGILGGTFGAKDGLGDPNSVTQAFARQAMQLGVDIQNETVVTAIERQNRHIASVATNRGEVKTRTVVCCAGAWSSEIGKMVGIEIPIAPLRRQLHVTGPLPEFPRDYPFVIDFGGPYFHPEGDGVLFGMSNEKETPGFKFSIDEAYREKTLERAMERLPLLGKAEIAREWAGVYEVTPDHHPILSKAQALDGFYVAAGFSGHGFMHSPATGMVMSEIILDGRLKTIDVSELYLERFKEGRLIEEANVI